LPAESGQGRSVPKKKKTEHAMWQDLPPDETFEITARGHCVAAYANGAGDETLLLLNGGPGLCSQHLRAPHLPLVEHGYRIVIHDQLDTGASAHPGDPALWTLEGYVQEVEALRRALGLGRIHLLGHSWGGWLAIEYALTHPDTLQSLVLADTCGDIPHLMEEAAGLKAGLGEETAAMMAACERKGRFDDPDYLAAVAELDRRHVFTMKQRPAPSQRSADSFNLALYNHMQGPNEYVFTGNLKSWSRIDELTRLTVPTLVIGGRHDVMTPACTARLADALPNAQYVIFENSSHVPHYEENEAYIAAVGAFLDPHPAT
jgi:proline iminopeptidase